MPAIPGCVTEGESLEELLVNLHEAIEGCLSVDLDEIVPGNGRCIEIRV